MLSLVCCCCEFHVKYTMKSNAQFLSVFFLPYKIIWRTHSIYRPVCVLKKKDPKMVAKKHVLAPTIFASAPLYSFCRLS